MVIPFEWEVIDNSTARKTFRSKVIGGWVVMVNHNEESPTMVFVADAAWDWELS